jgi:hypothetical protein
MTLLAGAEAALEQSAPEQSSQEQSLQRPTAQPAQNWPPREKRAYGKAAEGLLHSIMVVVVLTLFAERARDACLEGFLERRLDLLDFVLASQLQALFLGEVVALAGLVYLFDLDDFTRRGADRHHQLLSLLGLNRPRRLSP